MAVEPTSPSRVSSTSESPLKTTIPLSDHDHEQVPRLERQAVKKLDYTIVPMMGLFYGVAFLDRIDIADARAAGLQKDLNFTDKQFQIWLTFLFVPYIISDLPSNLLLRKIGPGLFMPALLTSLGVIATLQGLVTSYRGLLAVRTFMALIEGTIYPATVLYLSCFYTRKDLSLRIAMFFSPVTLSGHFSGFLAFLIDRMNGVGGKPGWAWIFILEGLFTFLIGILGFFAVPSTPHDSKSLTQNQKDALTRRLEKDRPSIIPIDTFSLNEVVQSLTSPHVIILSIMFFMNGAMFYGLTPFVQIVDQQLGYGPIKTVLMGLGPFSAGLVVTMLSASLSDRYQSRGITSAVLSMLTVIGYALYLGTEDKFAAYAALHFIVSGTFGTAAILAAWVANNSEPHYRRATSIALFTIMSSSGGILSNWSFPIEEAPKFRKTAIINLIFSILLVLGSLINMTYLSWKNKVKKCPKERTKLLEKYTQTDIEGANDGGLKAWIELGDRHPDFVYIL